MKTESCGKLEAYKIEKLDRARKKRHYLMYGIGQIISSTEARSLIETARAFLDIIKEKVGN